METLTMSSTVLRPFSTLLAASLFSIPLASAAPGGTPAPEQAFLDDLPVVLSVSHLAQPISEAPGSVTVIDSETIRLSGARDVPDLFRLVPGFQVGATGGAPRLYYHGALDEFGQHLQVLIDGRSVYSPFLGGGINWNNVPLALEDIERIEAVRGSNSAAYGANAFLGAVNIVTRPPSQTPRGWTVSQAGGAGIRDSLLRYSDGFDNGAYRLTVGRRADPGSDNTKSERDVHHFNFRSDWRVGLMDEFQLQLGGTDSSAGIGRPDMPGDLPRQRGSASDFILVSWQRSLAPGEEIKVQFHHTDERKVDSFLYPDPRFPGLVVDQGGTASRDSVEAQYTFSPAENLRLVWGGELRHDLVTSLPLYGTSDSLSMNLSRLFANLEWRMTPEWLLNLGANTENSSLSGRSTSPRVMLNWHATPQQTLRAGVSSASRSPSLFEEKADVRYVWHGVLLNETFLGRGKLGPEYITSRELGYLGDFRSLGLLLDARLFHESIHGLARINTYPDPLPVLVKTTKEWQNGPDISIRGLEYQLKYRPWPSTQIMLNQAFMQIASPYPLSGYTGPGDRQAAPSHSTSIALFQKLPGNVDLSVLCYAVGAMYWAGSDAPQISPAYRRLDVRLAYPFRVGATQGEVAVTAQNLGSSYADTDPYYLLSRRIFTKLSLNF